VPGRSKKKQKRLTPRERELASRFIPQEHRARRYGRVQAVAVGISRAREQAERERVVALVKKYT
jgi:hypothetical protein